MYISICRDRRLTIRGCLFAIGLWLSLPAAHAEFSMGFLGDSLTDEYLAAPNRAHTDLAAYNWVQILALTRAEQFNFGAYRQPDDYWPDTRGAGYEYNWAKVGSAASPATRLRIARLFNMRASNRFMGSTYLMHQAAGLLPYIQSGKVDVVFIGAGSNDFFYHTNDFSVSGAFKPKKKVEISQDFIDSVAGSLIASLDIVLQAGADSVVLALVPMGTASADAGSEEVLKGIAAVNEILEAGALERGVALVDLFGFTAEEGRANADGSVNIAGKVLTVGSAATGDDLVAKGTPGAGPCNSSGLCAAPGHADHYRAEDGLHPNTLVQGLIANQVIGALNRQYGLQLDPLTDEEILALTSSRK